MRSILEQALEEFERQLSNPESTRDVRESLLKDLECQLAAESQIEEEDHVIAEGFHNLEDPTVREFVFVT